MKLYALLIGLFFDYGAHIDGHSPFKAKESASKSVGQALEYKGMNAGWMVSIAAGFSYKNGRMLTQKEREWLLSELNSYSQFANREVDCIKCFPMSENDFAPNQYEIGIKVTPQQIRMGMLKNINTDDFKDSTSFEDYARKVQHIVQTKKIISMDELWKIYHKNMKRAAGELKKIR